MLYILNILNAICQTYFNEKGSSNRPQCCFPLNTKAGMQSHLVALRCSNYMNIFSTVQYMGNFSFSSNSLHPFSSYLCHLENTVQHLGITLLPRLHPALRAAALSCTEPLRVSGLTKAFVQLSFYLTASREGVLFTFIWKLLCFLSLLSTYSFKCRSTFTCLNDFQFPPLKDKISVFPLRLWVCNLYGFILCFLYVEVGFSSQKNMHFWGPRRKVWHILCNDGLLAKYTEESFLNINYSDLKEFLHDGQ